MKLIKLESMEMKEEMRMDAHTFWYFSPFSTCVWFEVSVKWKWSVTAGLTEWQTNWLAAELLTWLQAGRLSGSCSSQRWWTVFWDKSLAALWVQHRAIWQTCLMKESDTCTMPAITSFSLMPWWQQYLISSCFYSGDSESFQAIWLWHKVFLPLFSV